MMSLKALLIYQEGKRTQEQNQVRLHIKYVKTYKVGKHKAPKEAVAISPCSSDGSILLTENLQKGL